MFRTRVFVLFIVALLVLAPSGRVGATSNVHSQNLYSGAGDLDTSFGTTGIVTTDIAGGMSDAVAIQPDGKIVVAGSDCNCSGNSDSDFALARYKRNGSLDMTFGSSGQVSTDFGGQDDDGNAIAIQSDGRIVVAGNTSNGPGNSDFALARYNGNGSLDTTFDSDGKVSIDFGGLDEGSAVVVQSDGKIVVAGSSFDGAMSVIALVRYNSDGSLDTTFDSDGKVTNDFGGNGASASGVALQSDGKILVSGASNSAFALARYNVDGSLDTTFGTNGTTITHIGNSSFSSGIAIQKDDKIVLAGTGYRYAGSDSDFELARYNSDGSLDTTFDGDGKVLTNFYSKNETIRAVASQLDGKIVVAGYQETPWGYIFALARYNFDGSLDTTFTYEYCCGGGLITTPISGYDFIDAVAIQSDGRIVVTGTTNSGGFTVARYNGENIAPVLLSPDGGALLLNNRPTFNWLGVPGATKYELQISENYKFAKLLRDRIVKPATLALAEDLPAGLTLLWRVRAYTAAGAGRWSISISFKTAKTPSIPALISPDDGARLTDYTPQFDWKDSKVPTGTTFLKYQLQLIRGSKFAEEMPVVNLSGLASNSQYTPSMNLTAGANYSWRVRAVNTLGQYSSWSKARSFHLAIVDPETKIRWTPAGSMMDAGRFNHTATLLPDGRVLAVGGFNGFYLDTAKLYNPATNSWTDTNPLLSKRDLHTATLLQNGKVLVVGGENASGILSTAELYDPASGAWTSTGSLNTGRYAHSATLLANGKVLVAGGVGNNGILDSTEVYDPNTETWTLTGSVMNASRYGHTATLLPDGSVLVTGGDSSSDYLSSVELYDPVADTWTMKAPMSTARHHNTATLLPDGRVLIAGGAGPHSLLASVELYNPSTDTWTLTGSLNQAHSSHTATLLPDGRVLVAGGVDGDSYPSTGVELYNPATGIWKPTASLVYSRSNHTATLLLNDEVLVVGGSAPASGALSSSELYNPAPILLTPANGARLLNNRPSFDWANVTGAAKYELQVAKNAGFSALVQDITTIPSTHRVMTDLPAGLTLYWRVRAYSAAGAGPWSAVYGFRTANPPSIPTLLLPANNTLTSDYTPRLDWSTSAMPIGTTFQKYELQLSAGDGTFASATSVDVAAPATNSEYTPVVDLTSNTKYYWRVRAYNTDGQYSNWSAVRYFRTALLAPTLSAPTDTSSTSNRKPTFNWVSPPTGATSYLLQVSKTGDFSTFVLNVSVAGISFTPTTNLPPGTLYWRVRANGPNGPSTWATPFHLTIN